ncbi:4a-hydroxytetrahydrobiopterin dehydratase [Antribacter sp. KLBMP9083]|uniref:Putative pterin-4-alpha-carbinolamine dehydratase n=1 Tax=Antribacter soli TaxID=2910976 RepID=A0AA41QFQ6_9MICO|nr:VOC family protein [Antribacter soli]MCF4121821.1 4a-hydroxytetrahydrobiopterin dehydratase [Antribacter soli]
MTTEGRITPGQFHAADGVEDWRVLLQTACARFATGSFVAGAELVDAITELAEAANHHPDVDLRYPHVTVRLTTHDVGGLSQRDIDLARQISDAARELEIRADPRAVQELEIAIDALDRPAVRPFWRAVLGYAKGKPDDLVDPAARAPSFWFQQMDAPRPQRNRIHVDVTVPHDVAEERVAATLAAGGRLVTDAYAPSWWVLADAEGNEACVCTWLGRE